MKRHDGDATRKRILEQAEHLIHLQGYRGTSLDEIAKRCKMTKANLFHHFRSKEELGLAVLDYKASCYREHCLDRLFAPGRPAEEAVAAVFDEAACFLKGNGCKAGCFIGNIALEMSDLNVRFRERANRFFEEWSASLAKLLKASGHDGHAAATAEAVLELYEGATMLARARRDPSIFVRAKDNALALLRARREAVPTGR
jgi:TetR/AcrR family transcriptional repressor of nem operon